jgi:hypothetical protein
MDLRRYLFEKKISIVDFSKTIECDRAYLSKIVNGKLKPSKRLAKDIEKATNGDVKAEELLKEKGE